jgi:hypothetical protein
MLEVTKIEGEIETRIACSTEMKNPTTIERWCKPIKVRP